MTSRAGLAVLLGLGLLGAASGALFAVDLGTEFLKISIVKPGRIPISVVINEMSKRKTPAMVAFVNGERLVGEEASALSARYPERVYMGIKDWLGRPAGDAHVQRLLKEKYLPYTLVPGANSSSLAVQTDTGATYAAEEVVGSLLEYAKQLAEAAADGAPTADCVLTVPSYFTPAQRQSLLDAAKLAGLNVMGLIHSHAAAALQYGIERDFSNRTETVLFYDMGSGTVEAALVRFSSYNSKGASISQMEVLDVAWLENLGGDNLEVVLMDHFADEFNAKLGAGKDVRSSPKAMAKLRNQVKRTKQILSANSEAPTSVEELFEDRDFRSTITREKFEELAGDFWQRATLPLTTLLERNNLTSADLDAVELLGGGSRVPRLKQALSEALGGRALDMHLDGDEACVLGAGLFAANLSTTFRLRKFGMTDKVPYTITLKMEGGAEDDPHAGEKVLVPAMKKMPTKRVFSKSNVTADSLAFTLSFDNEQGAVVPSSVQRARLGRFEVSGIQSVVEKYGESGKVSIHTRVDQGGMFHLEGAESVLEVIEVIPDTPPPAANDTAGNGTAAGNSTESEGAAAGEEGAAPDDKADAKKAETKEEEPAAAGDKPLKTRKKTVKVPLNMTGEWDQPGMTKELLEASKRVLRALRLKDQAKRETAKAKNDLESYIISTRDKLESDEELHKVTTEAQREAFLAKLNDMEDWLYEDGDTATAAEYRDQLKKLKDVGNPMFLRLVEHEVRPKVVEKALDFVELAKKAANSWPEMKPWLNATDIQAMLKKVEEFASWLTGKVKEQEKKAAHEDPAFESSEVSSWLDRVKKAFNKLNSKKKPKPPPPPPPPPAPANVTENGGNATDGSSAGAAGDAAAGQAAGEGASSEEGEEESEGGNAEEGEEEDLGFHDELRR